MNSEQNSSASHKIQGGNPRTVKSPREKLQPVKPPKAPKRSRHARNPVVVAINFFFSMLVLAAIGIGGLFYWASLEYSKPGPLTAQKTVVIDRGAGLRQIAEILQENEVISFPLVFMASVSLQKKQERMKAGEYLFKKGASMKEVVDALVNGKSVLYRVTLPEGLTSQKIVDVLKADDVLTGDIDIVPLEGSLLPDTYTFNRGMTRMQIIEQMQNAQRKALQRVWKNRVKDLPLKTPRELLTLASIVEKETGKAGERTQVAGVFINRLRRGMKLQSDPTIIYGLFGGAGKPSDRPIYKSDLTKTTPYNTYIIAGLPPGPISNPGIASLEAVANPSITEDLFFVADGTGGHAFAKTLDEHNNNVRRWRQIEKERAEAAKKSN